ncbi:hypothetical protein RCL1_003377 [Eukaryota sp. TZLM3-RCL]
MSTDAPPPSPSIPRNLNSFFKRSSLPRFPSQFHGLDEPAATIIDTELPDLPPVAEAEPGVDIDLGVSYQNQDDGGLGKSISNLANNMIGTGVLAMACLSSSSLSHLRVMSFLSLESV